MNALKMARCLTGLALITFTATSAWSADLYYDGGDGTWNSTANWSTDSTNDTPDPGAVPGALDTAHFNRSGNDAVNQIIDLGAVQSALGLVFSNSGTTTLHGSPADHGMNLDTGGITVNSGAGDVTIGSNTAGESLGFVLLNPQTWTNNSANALTVVNNMSYIGGLGNLTLDGTGTGGTIAGNINSGGFLSIVKNGSGTWTLSGNNVIGGTTINDGTIVANGSGTTPISGFVVGDGAGAAGSAVLRFQGDDQASVNGGNTINADGEWDLNGFNQTFNAGVTMNGGTVTNSGTGTLTFAGGGFAFSSGVNTVQGGNVDLGGNTHGLGSGAGVSALISANLSNGAVSKSGAGTLTLSGNNTYAGGTTLMINGGTLNVNSNTALGTGTLTLAASGANTHIIDNTSGSPVTLANNNVISIESNFTFGGSNDLNLGTGAVTAVNNNATKIWTMNGNATLTLGGNITFNTATNGLSKRGDGTLVILGNSNMTGTMTIFAGTLSVPTVANTGINQPLGAGSGAVVMGSTNAVGTLKYTGSSASTNRPFSLATQTTAGGTFDVTTANTVLTLNGLVSGGNAATNLTKLGSGTLVLAADNTYSSTTVVTAGTLLVNGGATAGSNTSPITVNGGTLGGSGTIRGTVVVNTATLAPGTSPGTLTILNALTLNSGSILDFELDGTDLTVGGGVNDLIDQVTNLTLDGTLNVDALGSFAGATAGDQWQLINYTGSLTDNTLALGTMPALASGLSFAIDTGTTGQVNLIVIPEPGSIAILALSAAAMLRRRGRSQ